MPLNSIPASGNPVTIRNAYPVLKKALVAGTNITITFDDASKTVTFASSGGTSSTAWGSITGTLSAQTDLQVALDGKATLSGDNTFLGNITASNLSGTNTGDQDLSPYALAADTREMLTADRTYYVNAATGSDANDGLSVGSAFATIPAAVAAAYALDLNGHAVTISVADGTYTDTVFVSGPLVGRRNSAAQPLQIIGNEAAPANVLISTTSGNGVVVQDGAYLLLAGVKTQTTSGGFGWIIKRSKLEHRNCAFGNVFSDMIAAQEHSQVNALGPLTVSGNAVSFCHATTHSRVTFTDQTINFNGNTFSTYLWGLNDATVAIDGATITGTQPTGGTTVHNHSMLNAYSLVNAGGWGYLGKSAPIIEDGSVITADGFKSHIFYVRSTANGNGTDGLENNDARAFKSIQSCLNFIAGLPFNPANFSLSDGVHIQVADGTYAETLNLVDVKYLKGTLTGNTTTPGNVVVAGTSDGVTAIGLRTTWAIQGVKITAASGRGIRAENGSQVSYQNVEFGTASAAHLQALYGAVLTATGPYSISGASPIHLQALYGGIIQLSGKTLTITGTPAFSTSFARVWNNSAIMASGTVYSGSATGKRYDIRTSSSLDTGGAGTSALPGDVAGTTASGGQYA